MRSPLLDREHLDGIRRGLLAGAAVLVLVAPPAWRHGPPESVAHGLSVTTGARAPAAHPARLPDFAGHAASADARTLAAAVLSTHDHGARPFAIIDKRDAQLYVFGADGKLAGATPILLGYAAGDDTVPDIGLRPIAEVKPHERTTPAGRFVADRGRNTHGDNVVWVDYHAAVSMHPVRLTNPAERRAERLASATSDDNRISYGCINIPPDFFAQVVWPSFGQAPGNIVYVLPETKPLAQVFKSLLGTGA